MTLHASVLLRLELLGLRSLLLTDDLTLSTLVVTSHILLLLLSLLRLVVMLLILLLLLLVEISAVVVDSTDVTVMWMRHWRES